jgi:hypothetical protein
MKSTKFYRVYSKTHDRYLSTSKSTIWNSPVWVVRAANAYIRRNASAHLEIHAFDVENAQTYAFIDFKKTFDEARAERVAAEAAKRESEARRREMISLECEVAELKKRLAEADAKLTAAKAS